MRELSIDIRGYSAEQESDLADICYETGFMGSSLAGTGRFNDRKLFSMLFCLYYTRHEGDTCFVACDGKAGDKTVGYIIGTDNTLRQGRDFDRKMMPRVIARLFTWTWWRHPESFREVMAWARGGISQPHRELLEEYPGHLHINVIEAYQNEGLGTRLLEAFEERMRMLGVRGIHLATSNYNTRAVPFYRKHGYTLLSEVQGSLWRGVENYHLIVMGKRL